MRTHVSQTVLCCFAALRRLCSIRHLDWATVFQSLVAALVLSHMDYGNGTMVGRQPTHLIRRLQSVQNAAARLIFRLRSDHTTDSLINLHWLRVPERIVFKAAVQTYRALHGDALQYLRQFTSIANIPTRQILRSFTSDDLCVPAVRLPTVGRCAFSVAGARVWNALPADVTSAPPLFTFRKRSNCIFFHLPILALSSKLIFFLLARSCGSCLLLRPP